MNRSMRHLFLMLVVATAMGATSGTDADAKGADLTQTELTGRWEAMVEEEPRIFVLDVESKKTSTITMIAGMPPHVDKMVFKVRTINVGSGGNTYVEATHVATGLTLKITGKGHGRKGAGHIVGSVELWGKPEFGATVFPTTFRSRGKPGYFAILASQLAEAM